MICDWTAVTFIPGFNGSFLRCSSISSSLIPTRMSRAIVNTSHASSPSLTNAFTLNDALITCHITKRTKIQRRDEMSFSLLELSLTFCYFGNVPFEMIHGWRWGLFWSHYAATYAKSTETYISTSFYPKWLTNSRTAEEIKATKEQQYASTMTSPTLLRYLHILHIFHRPFLCFHAEKPMHIN